jgi:hypothetical protein
MTQKVKQKSDTRNMTNIEKPLVSGVTCAMGQWGGGIKKNPDFLSL